MLTLLLIHPLQYWFTVQTVYCWHYWRLGVALLWSTTAETTLDDCKLLSMDTLLLHHKTQPVTSILSSGCSLTASGDGGGESLPSLLGVAYERPLFCLPLHCSEKPLIGLSRGAGGDRGLHSKQPPICCSRRWKSRVSSHFNSLIYGGIAHAWVKPHIGSWDTIAAFNEFYLFRSMTFSSRMFILRIATLIAGHCIIRRHSL